VILAAPTPPTSAETTAINAPIRYSPTRPGTAAASTLQTEPTPNVTPATTYTVVSGDNLTVVAKKNHLTIAELAAANNISASTKLHLGQKLIIPSKVAAPAKVAETTAISGTTTKPVDVAAAKTSGESIKHIVKAGDTLSTIAKSTV